MLLDRSLCDRLVAPARAIVSAPVDRPQPLRPVFPRVAYADACEDDRQDDVGVYPFAGERRGGGGKHQHEEQRVAKLVDENTHPRQLRPRMNLIRPERVQPADSLGLRKTIRRRVEAQQRGRLERPKTASGSGDAVVDVQSVTGRVTPGFKSMRPAVGTSRSGRPGRAGCTGRAGPNPREFPADSWRLRPKTDATERAHGVTKIYRMGLVEGRALLSALARS